MPIRQAVSLNGLWDFAFLDNVDLSSFAPGQVVTAEKMMVPGAFDAQPGYEGRRGTAVYRTRFEAPAGRKALLKFGAVSMWARIYVDGQLLRENACGYAPFSVEAPASGSTIRELTVVADNRYDFSRVPMHREYFDFYQYGGILRGVTLQVLPGENSWIEAVRVLPGDDYRAGKCGVAIHLGGDVPADAVIETGIDGNPAAGRRKFPVKDAVVSLEIQVPDARLWSPENPHLHSLRVTLCDGMDGGAIDEVTVRFGLRKIEARDGALWLNGEKLILRGYNRHEWHPNSGPSTPVLQMYADIRLLKGLGCNFVRGSHYPQDQRFLDLCDELGMLVWEENLGWGQREDTFASEKFRADHLAALRSMVRASWNHPSVIIWGFLNEAWSDQDYVRPVFEESVATLRAMDPSRLVSFATMCVFKDKQYDLVDLISLNIYPGWYGAEGVADPVSLIRPHMEKCFAHIDSQGWGHKPVIISEIGAEALYGWREPHNDFFSEEYQARYLGEACRSALENPRCSGIALWHFSDARTYGGGRALGRPRTFNNKGSFDEYRRPKAAASVVRGVFQENAGEK